MDQAQVIIRIKTKSGAKITKIFDKHDNVRELTTSIHQYINESHRDLNSVTNNVDINCCINCKTKINADPTASNCCFP